MYKVEDVLGMSLAFLVFCASIFLLGLGGMFFIKMFPGGIC